MEIRGDTTFATVAGGEERAIAAVAGKKRGCYRWLLMGEKTIVEFVVWKKMLLPAARAK